MQAQLGVLKMQLQPHFLFNTLNAIMVLVRQQKARQAEQMLAHLSDLLRCVLEDVEAQEVPLRRELEYLQLYLSIEQVRFQDRLRVEITADPNILDAAVPQMALQPIVENAVRHGIGRSSSAGRITISATRANDTLELRVEDDGPGFPSPGSVADDSPLNKGIGLANTRARLQQLYGAQGRLQTENDPRGGARVTMVLPYHVVQGSSEPEVMEVHALHDAHR
jgi:two-component system LytT family sensor kinase